MKSLFRNLKGALAIGACAVSTILCFVPIMVMAIFKLLLPIASIRRTLTRWIMGVGEIWIDGNALIFGLANNTRWDISGLDNLDPDKWYLVVVNHLTWVDIVVLQTILNRRIPFLKFFIKQQLIWFPFLGQAWWAMDMPFMKRYSKSYLAKHPDKKGKDLEATRIACQKFRQTPTSVINFIEGTRFSELKRQKRASRFMYLLPPRAGGIALALATMGDMFDAILDVTLVYPGAKAPQFWEMACGEFEHVIAEVRQRPVEKWMVAGDYANDREFRTRFHRWLTDVWQDKDQRIGEIKAQHDDVAAEATAAVGK